MNTFSVVFWYLNFSTKDGHIFFSFLVGKFHSKTHHIFCCVHNKKRYFFWNFEVSEFYNEKIFSFTVFVWRKVTLSTAFWSVKLKTNCQIFFSCLVSNFHNKGCLSFCSLLVSKLSKEKIVTFSVAFAAKKCNILCSFVVSKFDNKESLYILDLLSVDISTNMSTFSVGFLYLTFSTKYRHFFSFLDGKFHDQKSLHFFLGLWSVNFWTKTVTFFIVSWSVNLTAKIVTPPVVFGTKINAFPVVFITKLVIFSGVSWSLDF